MQELNPKRVLIIVAHPDDPEFGAAGTIAHWARQGTVVRYVIVTDGSKGSDKPGLDPAELSSLRHAEQRAAADILGVEQVIYLDYVDGDVFNTTELRRDIVRQIRAFQPDLVITHDPTTYIVNNSYINHPDHRHVGAAALDCVFPLARSPYNFPEQIAQGLEPHAVMDILLQFTSEPNLYMDISETMDLKIAALKVHASQTGGRDDLDEYLRNRARERAIDQEFEYGEHFRHIRLSR